MRMRFTLLLCSVLLFSYFCISYPVYAKDKLIKYLPRDEAMDMVTGKNLPVTVYESFCPKLEDVSRELEFCNRCVSEWKPKCPDCCLAKGHNKRAIRCTPKEDPGYDCTPPGFLVNDCNRVDCAQYKPDCSNPHVIPSCQRKGCPDPKPNGTCSNEGSGSWICSEQNLNPLFAGCNPNPSGGLAKCSAPYYDVTTVPVYDSSKPPKIIGYKYRYELTRGFSRCVNGCLQYTDEYERCSNGAYCCRMKLCAQQGYDTACDQGACENLVANPKCDDYTTGDCISLQAKVNDCLRAGVSGDCYSCFKEIDMDPYKFVARSREKIVVAWQITASPLNVGDTSAYFYTMVKVFDDATGNPVHESFVSQKSLIGSFTIFSATAVDKKDTVAGAQEYVLEPGHAYTVKPYYFIPPVGQGLSVRIDQVQLIIVRTRE